MFTPAGEKSRAGARPTRLRARPNGADQATMQGVGGPLSYSYGSPNARNPSLIGARGNNDSIAGAFNAAIRESEYSIRLPSADAEAGIAEDDYADEDSIHGAVKRRGIYSSHSKGITAQDVEASVNRRRSLRSSSRSIGRGSPSIISELDYQEQLNDVDTSQSLYEHNDSQSSVEEELDDDALLGQLGMPVKDSQYHTTQHVQHVQNHDISECGAIPAHSAYLDALRRWAAQRVAWFRAIFNSTAKRIRTQCDWRHYSVLACLVLVPALLLFSTMLQFPRLGAQPAYSHIIPGNMPETSHELGRRLVSLEEAIAQLQSSYAELIQEGASHRKAQESMASVVSSLASGAIAIKSDLNEAMNDIKAVNAQHVKDRSKQNTLSASLEQLQVGVSALEKKFTQQQHDLAAYVRAGGNFGDDVSALRADLAEQKEALRILSSQQYKDNGKLRDQVIAILDAVLPAELPVYKKASGELHISPEFWSVLDDVLKVNDRQDATSSETILAQQGELRNFVKQALNEYLSEEGAGLLATKDQFLSLLKDEFASLAASLESRLQDLAGALQDTQARIKNAGLQADSGSPSGSKHNATFPANSDALDYLVSEAILRHSLDAIAKPDFAAYNAGGRVNPFLTSPTYMHSPKALVPAMISKVLRGIGSSQSHPPAVAIHPSTKVGMCWAFPGSQGKLAVRLSHPIQLSDIVVEHVHPEIAHDISSAPRAMEIWAHLAYGDDVPHVGKSKLKAPPADGFMHVMDIEYNAYGGKQAAQIFPVPPRLRQTGTLIDQILLKVTSNWGNAEYTCIYRVRALGEPVKASANKSFRDDESL
jgi:hypothetical protein